MAEKCNSKCAKPLGHLAPTLDQAGNYTFDLSSAAQLLNFPFSHSKFTYLQRAVVWPPSFRFHFCFGIHPLPSHWPGSYVYSGCFCTKSVTPLWSGGTKRRGFRAHCGPRQRHDLWRRITRLEPVSWEAWDGSVATGPRSTLRNSSDGVKSSLCGAILLVYGCCPLQISPFCHNF